MARVVIEPDSAKLSLPRSVLGERRALRKLGRATAGQSAEP